GIRVIRGQARRIPLVDSDGRRAAAVREVADDQHVTRPVELGSVVGCEPGCATDFVAAEGDRVLEEPEPLLGVAAVVEAIRAEVDDVAGRAAIARAGRTSGQGVTGRIGVLQVVLVRQTTRAVLPRPVVDVLRVLRSPAREKGAVSIWLLDPRRCRCAGGRAADAAFRVRLCGGQAEAALIEGLDG